MKIIKEQLKEVRRILKRFELPKTDEDIFYHLCFCIAVPQAPFKTTKIVVDKLRTMDFFHKHVYYADLLPIIKPLRFHRKAAYLLSAKTYFSEIRKLLNDKMASKWVRKALVMSVDGLGMKTASHFLRNMGRKDLAILDTHILRYLKHEPPRNAREYEEIEEKFVEKARTYGVTPAELDALIWQQASQTTAENFVY